MWIPNHHIVYSKLSFPRAIFIKVPTLNVSLVSLWFRAGSRYAPEGRDGLPHLLEHLFICRNKDFSSQIDYLAEMERKGFLYGAHTFKDLVSYYFTCTPGKESNALRYLLRGYRRTIITEDVLAHERRVVMNEERRSRMNPARYIWRLADTAVWPRSEFSRDIFGSPETLRNVTVDDLEDFREKHYQMGNLVLLIITPIDVDPQKIVSEVEHVVEEQDIGRNTIDLPPVKRQIHAMREIDDIHLSVSYRIDTLTFWEWVAMLFIAHYLAGGWSARLIRSLRLEKGWTYWVENRVLSTAGSGYLRFYFSVKHKDLIRSINLVKEEVERIRSREIAEEAMNHQINSFLIKNIITMTNPYLVMNYYSRFLFSKKGEVYLYDRFIKELMRFKGRDIQSVAARHLHDRNLSIATIGSY